MISCRDETIPEIYIGSTSNFIRRRKQHFYSCNNPNSHCYNLKLYRFIRSNGGIDNFVMEILERCYEDEDKFPVSGISYYRLKQTDFNGESTYSHIVPINYSNNYFSIYPNPADGYVTIQLDDIPNNVVVQVKDVLGKTLLEPKGIYYVELVNESYKYAKKLVVQ